MSAAATARELRRKNTFKNVDSDGRRKREESRVKIRKKKKDSLLKKRRMLSTHVEFAGTQCIATLCSDILLPNKQLRAITDFRKLLSMQDTTPIAAIMHTGVQQKFVDFLTHADPRVQFQAAWALTNIASGTTENVQAILRVGALKGFVHFLRSPNVELRGQCLWGLANIAGDSVEHRDIVLRSGCLPAILALLNATSGVETLRNATWAICNLCRGKPSADMELLAPAIPALSQLVRSGDDAILIETLWAISYLTDAPEHHLEMVVQEGVVPFIIQLLNHPNLSVQTPAIRIVGNLVSGHDKLTQLVVEQGAVLILRQKLDSYSRPLRKEACWAISNIAAGNQAQIQALLDSDILPVLFHLIKDAQLDIRKESAWVLSNLAAGASSSEQKAYMAHFGLHKALCHFLSRRDGPAAVLRNVLDALQVLLRCQPALLSEMQDCGLADTLADLQMHQNTSVYDASVQLLDEFFDCDVH